MRSWLPWQSKVAEQLVRARRENRLPHGLLFRAKPGSGSEPFVDWWSQLLLCSQPSESQACGQCKSCHLVQNGSHPDRHCIGVLEDKRQIGIDQIRLLIKQLRETPQQSGWRLAIINPSELVSLAGFNALLKTLEEPGRDTQIIMVSHDIGRIPATVLSRCQLLSLDATDSNLAKKWLKEKAKNNNERECDIALDMHHQAPLAALKWLQSSGAGELESLRSLLEMIVSGERSFTAVARTFKADPIVLFRHWYFVVCRLIKIKSLAINDDKPNFREYQSLAEKLELRLLFKFRDELLFLQQQFQSGVSLNAEMQIDALAALWQKCRLSSAKT